MAEKQNTPEIRFEGFADPWEQRKLGNVAAVYDGVHQTPDYQDEGVMFLSVENIATLTSQKFISREAFARDYPVYPKRGDVLMTRIGDIGTSNVVETDDKLAFYVSLALLKPFDVDSYYLDKSLQSPSAKMELYRRTLHIAFPKKINKNQIAEVMLPIPRSRQEQEQIGALFRNLDTLITLHQRKYDKLCTVKKSMLDKMFPKPGETEPEIRFKGFTDPWEQRKLGDCFEFLKNNTLSRADLNGENGTARNVHYGDILIKFGDCLDGERSDLPFITDDTVLPKYAGSTLREGDVIFADTAEDEAAGKCVELRKLPKEPTISGLHTIPARPRFPFGMGYLGHYLNSDAYHRQLLPLMQGIKVISVSKAALQDTQVRFPGLSEQAAIGAALSEIGALITLHQRKLDLLKNTKKSLLDKMFV